VTFRRRSSVSKPLRPPFPPDSRVGHRLHSPRPRATPSTDRTSDTHHRVRTDRVDHTGVVTLRVNGRLHHIGIGRTHARTNVLLHDLDIRVVDAATGELLRETHPRPQPRLPTHRKTTRTHPQTKQVNPQNVDSPVRVT
jgi:hypothetical protein